MNSAPNKSKRPRKTAWLTIALGIAAFAPFILVFIQSSGRDISPIEIPADDIESFKDGLRMLDPSFTGRTQDGEPYTVTAEWALPDSPKPSRIVLKKIRAEMTLKDSRLAEITATDGVFFPDIKRLRIENGVALSTSDGYKLHTSAATVDAQNRTLQTDGDVSADGPVGSIRADLLEALDAEDRIVKFTGNVRVTIVPEKIREKPALAEK